MKMLLVVYTTFVVTILGAFPRDFSFGASTSALQTEGAWLLNGKSLAVWDNLARVKGYTRDHSNTENACNSYYLFNQDIAIMKEYGIKHYRMSVQWTRIMPYGVAGSQVNLKAVEHYRKMLSALRAAGIEPYVNLYHNDMPASLYILANGRDDEDFPKHFAYYADQCFHHFGDLVKYWFTFDEPWCQSAQGYNNPEEANTKPYRLGYNMLVAHAEAVHVYRSKYQQEQKGKIGVNLNGEMFWPLDPNSPADQDAARRNLMFQVGWFWNPIMTGDYPEVMKERVGSRLPQFTDHQRSILKGSADFFALNHYFSWVTKDGGHSERKTYNDDVNSTNSYKEEWKKSNIGFSIVPQGLYDLLKFIHETWLKDTNLPVYITENGLSIDEPNIGKGVSDAERIAFFNNYLSYMEKAIEEGVNVTKYFLWTLIDNFEWYRGYEGRFGITRTEYGDNYKRIPKASIVWYSELIKSIS